VRSRFRPEGFRFNSSFPPRTVARAVGVDGSMDAAYDRRIARRSVRRGAAGSDTVVLYGVGHFPHIEDAPAVADIIRNF
jgi:pimeloyl-ACP methyl ester carboxylesterase